MANFFKEYQAELKARRAAEKQAELQRQAEQKAYEEYFLDMPKGKRVKVNPAYSESGYLYFAAGIGHGCVLLTENKEEARHGYGYIYDNSIVIR